ncbi:DNA protecting protein DprA [Vibrio sp. 10N.286.49.C2]|uniref:DNA-processing protein DprA n=1 Tax=unclassified Vibrio TaxID=2614977 RepID=UPI000C817D2C|nr:MULTISPECIES: DNA-processing protein DprA [unclassified Vibrio]PMH36526.1 DNA protecting protein DprA [Vibrio sp. 10N.286.49.C2]PMH52431.1 DNA protecting protein DprA [Vibrio sp. 10N.286.49.B1]PMH83545.1 DNA protecting protein DprA [Vibrio sp. 10N.286.48.B7]
MGDSELRAWLTLALCPGVGSITFHKLCAITSPSALVQFDAQRLRSIGLKENQIRFIHYDACKSVEACLEWRGESSHHIILSTDAHYPALLRETKGYPPMLFVSGHLPILSRPQIAMVGSRNATREGLETAAQYGQAFSEQGFVVTSGLALGIDGHAHQGALSAGGSTIAVLGSGLGHIYPHRHKGLANRIREKGALVSEHPPFIKPRPEFFPRRNRIISGLSAGVLVVEATEKSGSLITARYAAEQGRDVFAIPGSIRHPFHSGCHSLIRSGAFLVQTPKDVVDEIESLVNWSKDHQPTLFDQVIDKEELPYPNLLANVGIDATPVDILAQKTHIPVHEVMQQLLELELLGHIVAVTGGYILKGRGKL